MIPKGSTAIALFAIGLVIVGFPWAHLINAEYCSEEHGCRSFLSAMKAMDPNEWGDLLAGVFSPLAFALAFLAVIIQARELKAQRSELQLATEQQSKMATALNEQAEIFRDEKRQRAQIEAQEEANAILEQISFELNDVYVELVWTYKRWNGSGWVYNNMSKIALDRKEQTIFDYVRDSLRGLVAEVERLKEYAEENAFIDLPTRAYEQDELVELLNDLEAVISRLSAGQKVRFSSLKIRKVNASLELLLDTRDFWKNDLYPEAPAQC